MLVNQLHAPDSGNVGKSIRKQNPGWLDIELAIRRLDGIQFTEVALMVAEATGMSICGGLSNRYLCEVIVRSEQKAGLVNPEGSRFNCVEIAREGDAGWYPEYWVVGLDEVMRAAETYAHSGELDPSLKWEF